MRGNQQSAISNQQSFLLFFCLLAGCQGINKTGATKEAGPEQLSAVAADGAVTLEWSPVVDANSYTLYVWAGIAPTSFADAVRINSVSSPHTHDKLQNGTVYAYAVTANTPRGETQPSKTVTATPLPSAPKDLKAEAGDSFVQLTWTPENDTTYTLLWSVGTALSDNPTLIENVTTPHRHDKDVSSGVTYAYALVALRAGVKSQQSTTVTATLPSVPKELKAGDDGEMTNDNKNVIVPFTWSKVTDATSYKVVWKTSPDGPAIGSATANSGELAKAEFAPCQQYYAAVQAIYPASASAFSEYVPVRGCPGGCYRPDDYGDALVVDARIGIGDDRTTDGACRPYETIAAALGAAGSRKVWLRKGNKGDNNDKVEIASTLTIPPSVKLFGNKDHNKIVIDGTRVASGYVIEAGAGSLIEGVSVHRGDRPVTPDRQANEFNSNDPCINSSIIHVSGDNVTVKNCQLSKAKCALYCERCGSWTITDSIVRDNTYGVFVQNSNLLKIRGSQVIKNSIGFKLNSTNNMYLEIDGKGGENTFSCNTHANFSVYHGGDDGGFSGDVSDAAISTGTGDDPTIEQCYDDACRGVDFAHASGWDTGYPFIHDNVKNKKGCGDL